MFIMRKKVKYVVTIYAKAIRKRYLEADFSNFPGYLFTRDKMGTVCIFILCLLEAIT